MLFLVTSVPPPRSTLLPYTTLFRSISSPNTPGLRQLQHRASLEALLRPLLRAREATAPRAPLLVKIAPDLSGADREDIACVARSEEHTSELQSHVNLVCRLLLEKKK